MLYRSDLGSSTVSSSTSTGTLTEMATGPVAGAGEGWRSCNICLEDMADSDLVSHIHCTAVLCRECRERCGQESPGKVQFGS